MQENRSAPRQDPCQPLAACTYTRTATLLHNLPYILMTLFGGAVLFRSIDGVAWRWAVAVGYVLYGLVGALWIMVFVCPFCRFWGTDSCPCGYVMVRTYDPQKRLCHPERRRGIY